MSFLYFSSRIFYILSIFYLYFLRFVESTANSEECHNDKIRTAGTGTVLFNPTDVYKTCWSQEEIAILTARLILEDAIPDPKVISIQCNEDIEDLVDYFKAVIDTIRSNTKARKRHIMLMALTDLLGGYLHHAVLPKARRAYYAGAVDYNYMEKFIQLYEELKWFLRTSGQGWSKSMLINKETRVPPIEINKINIGPNDSCCHKLLYYEHEPVKTKKRAISTEKGIYFPLPFFDAKHRPTAIVVPLKRFALRNIESKRSAYVIMKFFLSAEKCLQEKNAKPEMFQKFQNNLYTWIDKEVIPKLNDDKFYAAFGGILRVQSTLKALGAQIGPATCNTDEGEEEVGAVPAVGCPQKRNKTLLIALLIVIVAWFLLGTCFICYRINNSRTTKTDKLDERKTSKPESSSSFSSSRWSSIVSRSSSRTSKSHKKLCKCCESSISEKSTAGYTSTSEYDSEKTRKKDKRKKSSVSFKGKTQSSPCVCPNDGPAIIDTKHSMKVLPSIAEMSENSLSKGKSDSLRKISFAGSGISSSDGDVRPCAPPWAQTKDTVLCPVLSDKSTNYSSSKSQTVNDSNITDIPVASSTKYEPSIQQVPSNRTNLDISRRRVDPSSTAYESPSNRTNLDISRRRADPSSTAYESPSNQTNANASNIADPSRTHYGGREMSTMRYNTAVKESFNKPEDFKPPLANSTFRNDAIETNDYGTSNTPESYQNESSKSVSQQVSAHSAEEYYYNNEVQKPSKIKMEPKDKSYYDYHMSACHSSISGNYDLFHKSDPNKPYIFGYDFQTSTSSDLSDDDDSK